MKLSMWMLERWFARYEPMSTIAQGECTIAGIRFYEGVQGLDDEHLYVCRMRDIYPASDSDQVLLMHRNDVISLAAKEVYSIFNSCLDAFEYYNEWERALDAARLAENPAQAIVDASTHVRGPVFAMDASLNLLAYSTGYAKGAINAFWDDYVLSDSATIPDLNKMRGSRAEQLMETEHKAQLFFEPIAAPYSYGVSVSIHDASGHADGHLVIASDEPLGAFELQVASRMAAAIDASRTSTRQGHVSSYRESVFADVIADDDNSAANVGKLARLLRWDDRDPLLAFCLSMGEMPAKSVEGVRRQLPFVAAHDVAIVDRDDIVGVIDLKRREDACDDIERFARRNGVTIGCSNICRTHESLRFHVMQARDASKWAAGHAGLARFSACALSYMTHSTDRGYVVAAAHPAVLQLQEHDAGRQGKLAETLRCFLRNERSYAKTAADLFVHRNTVLYRIERIVELTGIDLEDPHEREYLLASFMFLE